MGDEWMNGGRDNQGTDRRSARWITSSCTFETLVSDNSMVGGMEGGRRSKRKGGRKGGKRE